MKRGCLIGQEAHRKRKVKDGEVPLKWKKKGAGRKVARTPCPFILGISMLSGK